ncbi:MAG TPA: LacI family DNA-binding transcriptional regulator, partial [Anaerolineales bacterium]|nr:LacI family DNA-binding transcriptional regulator [Anaerolineales bacterium]
RMRAMRSTIKEVASKAGVSTQTVSRVINERPDVSPETRKRVQDVIEELGYQPSALARSLINQRSQTLGVVIAGLWHVGPSRVLSGIAEAAQEAGFSLLLKGLTDFDEKDIEPIFQALLSRHVDGIIWAVPEVGENHAWIHEGSVDRGLPLVFLTMEPQKDIPVVAVDNYLGGRMAMSHLLEQGYRRIGHISGPLDWWEARQRMAAWRDVLLEAGCAASENERAEGDWSPSSGARAAAQLLHQYPDLDAIFVANDQMALSAIQLVRQQGLRIPEDVGIVGFDNLAESAFFSPALTSIQQDQHKIAKIAVEEITRIIKAGWLDSAAIEPRTIMLPPTLVIRQSSLRRKEQEVKPA